MVKNTISLSLLPNGFVDLLPGDADKEARAIQALMDRFSAFGYQRVKPPLVEFEDSLFARGPGESLGDDAFRVVDPLSGRMMALRSDITPQIARIASSRLKEALRPLRLMYANDVLRVKGSQQRTERQFCQVGCEIIGRSEEEADVEVIVMALSGLSNLGVCGLTLDLTMPTLVDRVLQNFNVSGEDAAQVKDALSNRDVGRLADFPAVLSKALDGLVCASGPADQALGALEGLDLGVAAREDIQKLQMVYEGVVRAFSQLGLGGVEITMDFVDIQAFQYERGVAFSLFCQGVHGELGRGGRYQIVFGDPAQAQSATGFTLYMDTVRLAMPDLKPGKRIFVSHRESWSVIEKLQKEGWVVVRGTGQNKSRDLCTYEYVDGTIKVLEG